MKYSLVVSLIFMVLVLPTALGALSSDPRSVCARAIVSDISPTTIEIGDEFTVGITIDNCGALPAKDVTFELYDFSDSLVVTEPLVKNLIDTGYTNTDRFLMYHFSSSDRIAPGTYVINYRLSYGSDSLRLSQTGNFSIEVTGDPARLTLASAKTTPVFSEVGTETTISLRIENFGDGDANSIKAELRNLDSFIGAKKSFLGQLAAGDDGILVFNVIPQKSGSFPYELVLSYEDVFGTHEYLETLELSVAPAPDRTPLYIGFIVVAIIVAIGIGFIWMRKRKEEKFLQKLGKRGS